MLRAGKKGFLGLRTAPQTSPKLIHFPDLVIVVLHSITCYYLLTYMLVCNSRILNRKEQLGAGTSFFEKYRYDKYVVTYQNFILVDT